MRSLKVIINCVATIVFCCCCCCDFMLVQTFSTTTMVYCILVSTVKWCGNHFYGRMRWMDRWIVTLFIDDWIKNVVPLFVEAWMISFFIKSRVAMWNKERTKKFYSKLKISNIEMNGVRNENGKSCCKLNVQQNSASVPFSISHSNQLWAVRLRSKHHFDYLETRILSASNSWRCI